MLNIVAVSEPKLVYHGSLILLGINEAMKSIKQWPQHCVPITMKIYRAKKALTMPLTGQMWYTYAHVATAINTKYVNID